MIWQFLENVSVCMSVTKILWLVCFTEFHEILYLVLSYHKLMSVNFWWKLFNRWRCSHVFSRILEVNWSRFLMGEIAQKFIHKIYIIRNNIDAICTCSLVEDVAISFSPKFLWLSCLGFYCMKSYKILHGIYFKRWHWYNFCGHSSLRDAIVTIFPEFLA